MPAKPIPEGYEGGNAYLCCNDATSALEFYKTAFGAKELMSMSMPDGKIGHARNPDRRRPNYAFRRIP